jgi:F0F1-type ATP synthase membrane subunit c/vacuolar-type H+-ATPase subunit K
MLLLSFKFVASSIPLISLAGVAIGVGLIFASLVLSISRNPIHDILDLLIR